MAWLVAMASVVGKLEGSSGRKVLREPQGGRRVREREECSRRPGVVGLREILGSVTRRVVRGWRSPNDEGAAIV